METKETSDENSYCLLGKVIVKFLHEARKGATLPEIVSHLQMNLGKSKEDEVELNRTVEKVLKSGAEMGYLEKKGSHYLNWAARELYGRRRRRPGSCRCRRRRRPIRRRYRSRRRRRCH